MKSILIFTLLALSLPAFCQDSPSFQEGRMDFERIGDSNPTAAEYANMEKRCNENAIKFGLPLTQKNTNSTSLQWPLRAAAGFNDCSYYVISAYADHNPATGSFSDYNGGSVSYDGHRGTDIATYPFHFYKMDSNQVEVVAAAAGTIIDKHDGEFDRNCAGNSMTANYVIIQHADGSRILYWHMKSGKVTLKDIGQTAEVGEYLGVVGSSGSSSGPHLHFEVWNGSSVANLVDPFAGINNSWNVSSWWAAQKPHEEPAVIKASVHTTDADFASCPISEIPNESTTYSIPFQGVNLSAGYAKFYVFLRNATAGSTVNLSINNSDGSVYSASGNPWSQNVSTANLTYYMAFSKKLPTIAGIYTFRATYNGITCSQSFNILTTTDINNENYFSSLQVYPNPSTNYLNVSGKDIGNGICRIMLKNMLGQTLFEENDILENHSIDKTFSLTDFSIGTYFLTLETDHGTAVKKVVIHQK